MGCCLSGIFSDEQKPLLENVEEFEINEHQNFSNNRNSKLTKTLTKENKFLIEKMNENCIVTNIENKKEIHNKQKYINEILSKTDNLKNSNLFSLPKSNIINEVHNDLDEDNLIISLKKNLNIMRENYSILNVKQSDTLIKQFEDLNTDN